MKDKENITEVKVKAKRKKKIAILAGGTGGHIFPALEVAKKLKANGHDVHWIGTKNGLEANIIPQASIPISYVSVSGLRGSKFRKLFFAPIMLVFSLIQSLFHLKRINPDVVLGMGGFVSGPSGLAAKILGKKLIIHEQNSVIGTTNKILSRYADRVLCAFPSSFNKFRTQYKSKYNDKYILTGNPVREELNSLVPVKDKFNDKENQNILNVLVLGGSRGAKAINECIPKVLKLMQESLCALNIWHQTGEKLFSDTIKLYEENSVVISNTDFTYNFNSNSNSNCNFKVVPFINNMKAAYEWADIVICRSGALTVAELAVAGLPSILIPYPYAVDNHQYTNALHLSENGGAILLKQGDVTANKLQEILEEFLQNPKKLINMSENAHKIGNKAALDEVVGFCES